MTPESRLPPAAIAEWVLAIATRLLARSLNISIGVSDPGLSSAFGVTMRDGLDVVEERATRFRDLASQHLRGHIRPQTAGSPRG